MFINHYPYWTQQHKTFPVFFFTRTIQHLQTIAYSFFFVRQNTMTYSDTHDHGQYMSQESIRKENTALKKIEDAVWKERRALEEKEKILKAKREKLYSKCNHPNTQRSRDYTLYGETEYYCPDCGWLHYV